ncbi:ribonucleotide reductase inhibitor domain-containing protein [Trichoderma austrokoningii]
MSTPRNKRQFAGAAADPAQRQITSFFAAQSPNDPPSSSSHQAPSVPANVQANLLSVGMRVRKSVPEGYKTTGPSAFKLWTDTTRPGEVKAAAAAAAAKKPASAVSRELLPFCGINKVGGLDTQPEFVYDDVVPALDEIPELSMSQESADSTDGGPTRKRFFDEQDDFQVQNWDAEDVGGYRAIAVPHSRIKKGSSLKGMDQENMAVDGDEEFEDASFLGFQEGQAMDMAF